MSVGSHSPGEDEANLLYVAVTRAKKRLILTPTLIKLLDVSGVGCLHKILSVYRASTRVSNQNLLIYKHKQIEMTLAVLSVEQNG